MASSFAPDFVDRVRSAVDIVALVSESVPLKKAGRKYRGLCPFHPEKTPSFYLDDAKGLFYCFGCQAGGDSFKFVMLRENVEFLEAARILARKVGVPIPQTGGKARHSEREALLAAHKAAAAFYQDVLLKRPEAAAARRYLEQRDITPATIERLGIGFAPDRWDALKGHLVPKGFSARLLVTGGLLSRKEGRDSTYDRFRNRIIFPIRNLTGEVVGLGGRLIGSGEPKYLNSAETPIYNKRENLYGLDLTRHAIRDQAEAIVVEGYFDFASLFQAGVPNVVATLGTAFAEEQVNLLRRFAPGVVINYDPDEAGAAATRKSLDLLLSKGLKVRVLHLEEGDPDDYVRSKGASDYLERASGAPRYFDWLLARATAGRNLADYEIKSAVLREILPVIPQVPDRIERSGYVNALAERLGVDDEVMLAEIRDALLSSPRPRVPEPAVARSVKSLPEAESRLVRAMMEGADLRADVLEWLGEENLAGSGIEEIVRAVTGLQRDGDEITYARLSQVLREPARSLLARVAMRPEPVVSREEALRCAESLRLKRLRLERDQLQKEMQNEQDPARLDDLMRRKVEVSRQIDSLA